MKPSSNLVHFAHRVATAVVDPEHPIHFSDAWRAHVAECALELVGLDATGRRAFAQAFLDGLLDELRPKPEEPAGSEARP